MSFIKPLWRKVNSEESKGYRALLASAFAFSLMTVCVKQLKGQIPIAEIVLARAVISLLITRIMLKQYKVSPWGHSKSLLIIRGLLGTAALFCVFKAIEELPLSSATVIQYTYPTFTAIAAWLFLGENIRRRIGIAVILGWIGVTMVVNPNWMGVEGINGLPLRGIFIGLTGALLTALAYVCVRKLSQKEHPLVIVYYFPLMSIPVSLPFLWGNAVWPAGIEWVWLLGVGGLTQLGQIWITEGLRLLPVAHASSISYAQVLYATLWGTLFFSENINIINLIGAILVFLATLISISSRRQSQTKLPILN